MVILLALKKNDAFLNKKKYMQQKKKNVFIMLHYENIFFQSLYRTMAEYLYIKDPSTGAQVLTMSQQGMHVLRQLLKLRARSVSQYGGVFSFHHNFTAPVKWNLDKKFRKTGVNPNSRIQYKPWYDVVSDPFFSVQAWETNEKRTTLRQCIWTVDEGVKEAVCKSLDNSRA